jgi:hypothetical protein
MGRVVVLAILAFAAPAAISGQTLVVLHIRAVLTEADRTGNNGRRRAARNRHLAPVAAVVRQRCRAVDPDRTCVGIPG